MTSKIWQFAVLFTLVGLSGPATAEIAASQTNQIAEKSCSTILELSDFVSDFNYSSDLDNQTVFFDHIDDNYLYLKKKEGQPWGSDARTLSGSTPQGDPRDPIFILGPELSKNLGFAVMQTSNGDHVLRLPRPKLLGKWIPIINAVSDPAPLHYLPVRFGYATARQIFDLALDVHGPIFLKFPFADDHRFLTPHEAAYHYDLLFSREILVRTYEINELVDKFISFLDRKSGEYFIERGEDPEHDHVFPRELAAKLLALRSNELDEGTGNATYRLAGLRLFSGMRTYTEILKLAENYLSISDRISNLAAAVKTLSHPELTPAEALVLLVAQTIYKNQGERLIEHFNFKERASKPELNAWSGSVDKYQYNMLVSLLTEFLGDQSSKSKDGTYPRQSSLKVTQDWLRALDGRIKQVQEALKKANLHPPK